MKILRLALKGVPAFPGVVDLPIRDVPEGIVAVTGRNGRGKSTLMEVTPGVIYRTLPSRDVDVVTIARDRDSWMELEYEAGDQQFRARLSLDGPKRNTDAVLEQIAVDGGRRPLNDGKRSTYDAAIAERFPSLALFRTSVFAPQGQGNRFNEAKPSEKKDVFGEFLGLAHYLRMSRDAKAAADVCQTELDKLRTELERLQKATAPEIVDALANLELKLQLDGHAAERERDRLQVRITDLEARLASVADQAAAYTAAAARVTALTAAGASIQVAIADLQGKRTTLLAAAEKELRALTTKRDEQLADLDSRVAGNQQILSKATDIRAAVTAIAALDGQLEDARGQQDGAQRARTALGQELAAIERRIADYVAIQKDLARATSDSQLLTTVPCHGAGEYAACAFLTNATRAAASIGDLEARLAGLISAEGTRQETQRAIADVDGQLAALRQRLEALTTDRASHQAMAKYDKPLTEAETRIAELTTKRAELVAAADDALAATTARRDERTREIDDTLAQHAREQEANAIAIVKAESDLDAVASGSSLAASLSTELATARTSWDHVTRQLTTVANGQAELARRREELAATTTTLLELRRREALITAELLEWRDLEKGLGKGGLHDLEIDHAGPSISARANDLIAACFGPRFTLELVTQVPKADGSGMKDDFSVQVLDNEDPRAEWRPVTTLSGGERVIVMEALMLAIALYVNERADHPIRTLWRDETGSALDAENALLYVQMLRKARELGGFHHCWFVSHNPDAVALADAQIVVGDGTARLVLAPFQEAA